MQNLRLMVRDNNLSEMHLEYLGTAVQLLEDSNFRFC